jgi:hypothetical protein
VRALLLVLVTSCAAPQSGRAERPALVEAPADPEVVGLTKVDRTPPELSTALTEAFANGCGSCHDSRLASAKPEALAIFDLVDENWLVALPEARRQCTLNRIAGDDSVAAAAKQDLARILADLKDS